ncbi:MAG: Rieske (2Fe-2S) protein [Bacteroidota bacterium]
MKREEFIKKGLAAGAILGLAGAGGCSLFDDPEMKVCLQSEVPEDGFFLSRFNRKQIFLTYLEGELVIFSLICRHKQCTVKWIADDKQFACPCHDGLYDQYGEVIDGPPPGPLHRFKHEIRNGAIWVLNEKLNG